jgi:hypothetical protein
MPYLFIGVPTSLFSINNHDSNEHKVAIEVFDSNNESVFKKTYELAPKAYISQSKSTWLLMQLSIPSGNTKEWTFKATLDDDVTEIRQIKLQPWVTADVILYYDAENPILIAVSIV